MTRTLMLMLIAANGITPVHALADTGDMARGEQVFRTWCAPCHAGGIGNPGMALKPGTAALEEKYHGLVPALLSERTDLTPAVVTHYVRYGVSVMPFFRKTEISDAALADLIAYLTRNAKAP